MIPLEIRCENERRIVIKYLVEKYASNRLLSALMLPRLFFKPYYLRVTALRAYLSTWDNEELVQAV